MKSLKEQNRELAKSRYNILNTSPDIIPNQRYNYDVGSLFGVKLNPEAIPGYPAHTMPGNPNEIFFRPGMVDVLGSVPEVIAHESEHILEQRAAQRYNIEKPVRNFFFKNLRETTGDKEVNWGGRNKASQLYTNFFNAANKNGKVAQRLYDLGLSPGVMYIGKDLKGNSLTEVLASLSGFEVASNIDITQDPFLRKELFQNSEELIQAYKAVTGLRQERLDAKDPDPYVSAAPKVKQKGYFESLADLFSNPLMEDTTK